MSTGRYARHLLLPEVGPAGQQRLREARVVVVGAGGLGSPVLLYLAAAGVGRLDVIDDDVVDLTNLQRQVLHRTPDVGSPKVASASARLADLNPEVEVVEHRERLSADNVMELIEGADVVVDGTDNFATRYLLNDACVLAGVPLVWGSILRFDGQVSVWWAGHGPCYRCVFPTPPEPGQVPSCAEGGVLGAVAAVIGSVQATEVLKLLVGIGEPLVGRLLVHDALSQRWRELAVRRNPACAVCGDHPTITEPTDLVQVCEDPAVGVPTISAAELARLIDGSGAVRLVDVRGEGERAIATIGGSEAVHLDEFRSGAALADLARTPDDVPVVIMCKSGARSAEAVRLLAEGTGRQARSLDGGVLAWAHDIDPTMATY
ncbi:molybdopterin-synthase adenylyltransferase MoeB [Luteipulveratus mongoliensis]|uniref:Molybdopterin biosynthesis-like protein MoeZ n=1 Tax=Luteipulveratus mongoliensis TaxID=571913 RepID=A0A0K1JLM6_9MICO|nr:molybdopterin-synthase adenylyltransferase MoeB [Luteipulveratus mongoliensis]AKU17617.1 molybdopterin biosynthesis-like protein MoeZ [Luteipulveratus mongoliensis]